MVFPYIPMQENNPPRYDQREALATGTLFPGLNLPFFKQVKSKLNCDNNALCELMALRFAIDELGLYLDTHLDDQEALSLYRNYVSLAQEGRRRYEAAYGPIQQTDVTDAGWTWPDGPWPWEYEGGSK
jgi:spore coat protein JB